MVKFLKGVKFKKSTDKIIVNIKPFSNILLKNGRRSKTYSNSLDGSTAFVLVNNQEQVKCKSAGIYGSSKGYLYSSK